MTDITILSTQERQAFDAPPKFNKFARLEYFTPPPKFKQIVHQLRSPVNKVGFLLQLGYFRATGKFFTADQFRKRDINFVAKQVGVKTKPKISKYTKQTRHHHKQLILETADWSAFEGTNETRVTDQVRWYSEQHLSPEVIFQSVVAFCLQSRIEVPSYHQLSGLISKHYYAMEQDLFQKVSDHLSVDDCAQLNRLLQPNRNETSTSLIATLQTLNQSTTVGAIQQSVEQYQVIKGYFHGFKILIDELSLSDHATTYLATWTRKAEVAQLKSFAKPSKTHLYLLATIKDQYYRRQDHLVELFMKSVSSIVTSVNNEIKKTAQETQVKRNKAIKKVTQSNKQNRELIDSIESVMESHVFTDKAKVEKSLKLLNSYRQTQSKSQSQQLAKMEEMLEQISTNQTYYDLLEKASLKLQRRVSDIIKVIEFKTPAPLTPLLSAIQHFKDRDGDIGESPPLGFLSVEEKDAVCGSERFRVSLYKALLFIHIENAIQSCKITLQHSYQYRGVSDYLLDEKLWQSDKPSLLASAGLEHFTQFKDVINRMKKDLDRRYHQTNLRWNQGKNPHLYEGKRQTVCVRTPKVDKEHKGFIGQTLSADGFIPVQRILSDIDQVCRYSHCFKHLSHKHTKMKPLAQSIIAGIMGNGCNIGVRRLAKISVGISEKSLQNTVNWFFDLKNIEAASDTIISYIDQLSLANAYRYKGDENHTSSDGQKFYMGVDSLQADFSFKYFGKDKGITMYTFIDERQTLFYSTVISASEREATYVVDGLLNNNVVKSTTHSSDSHGFTEAIFATTHFMGVGFAPRLKNIGKQRLYGFSAKTTYQNKGYRIVPSRTIDWKLIKAHWDDILRFMVTIKLKHTSASQLFKRLNSYTKQIPLYKAIKEFGRIIKSIFILTYFDDLELRQRMEKQLSRIELSNRFSKAIYFANNQEMQVGSPEEQAMVAACKVLIQNAIVLWNYLALSEKILQSQDEEEKAIMTESILQGSVLSWAHVNLQGEYDFLKHAANESRFDLNRILALKVA